MVTFDYTVIVFGSFLTHEERNSWPCVLSLWVQIYKGTHFTTTDASVDCLVETVIDVHCYSLLYVHDCVRRLCAVLGAGGPAFEEGVSSNGREPRERTAVRFAPTVAGSSR